MAFSKQEQAIIDWSIQNGKKPDEIRGAISRFRTTGSPKDPLAELNKPEAPKPTIISQISEAAQAGIRQAKEGLAQGQTATNPVSMLEGSAKLGAGVINTAFSPLAPLFSPIGKLIGYVSDKISDIPGVRRFADSKAGEVTERVAEDVANLATIAGTAVGGKVAPTIVRGVAGTLSNAASRTSSSLAGIAETGAQGIQKATSAALDPAQIMQRVARVSKGKQADFERLAGESVGGYLVKRGIFGSIDEISTQLFSRFQKSRAAADRLFESLDERTGGVYKPEPVGTALNELFAREQRTASPGARSRDFARTAELKRKYDTEGLNMAEINEVKRLYERNVKVDYIKENKPENVASATNIDTAIREWQRNQVKDLGGTNLVEINKETQLARQLLDDLGREYSGAAGNNAITLTDWIIISELDPTAIGAFLAKKGLSNKGVQSAIAKKLAGNPEQPDIFPIFENYGQAIDSYGEWIKSIEKTTK